jgi:hypothetical protein
MCLIDDLREASKSVDPSLQPAAPDDSAMLGAVIHYIEHGDAFLQAAKEGPQAVSDLITGVSSAEPAAASSKPPADAPGTSSGSGSSKK